MSDEKREVFDAIESEVERRIEEHQKNMETESNPFLLGTECGSIDALKNLKKWIGSQRAR